MNIQSQFPTVSPMLPYAEHRIDVGDGHVLYVEEVGRPEGVPAVFLHGGPGGGIQPTQRTLFDPAVFRGILFDQRGAGRNESPDRYHANTTAHLVADIELIRTRLGIERWIVVGGSWGATLGLAYAEAHPERVTGLLLRAVFLGTREELNWAFLDGPARFRPELLEDFLSFLTPEERRDPLPAYWRRILDRRPEVHAPAAQRWHDYERVLSVIQPASQRLSPVVSPTSLPRSPFIEAHYFANDCFLRPDQLIADAARLRGIPGKIVQGRYDLLCPPATSARLADAWPAARIAVVERAGHSMSEPGITEAMRTGLAELAAPFRRQAAE
ncbi:MAG: prolyl aminopeptidase [Bauldia sp.]|nr:prolyl aminopeptidase [Bauldia sp.]